MKGRLRMKDIWKMPDRYSDTDDIVSSYDELNEMVDAQWNEMTREERDTLNTVMMALIKPKKGKPIPDDYFRDRSIEELNADIKARTGRDVVMTERLRVAMQTMQDYGEALENVW